MTTDLAVIPASADPEITAAMVVYERLKPLQDALGLASLTVPEMQLFAMVAHHTGLDPFTKQIYAVKRDGKVNHQTGIDGYRSVAESKGGGQYAGSDEATFEPCDCGKEPKDHPKIARVVVHRILPSGHVIDQVGIARWHELYDGNSQQFMWKKMPFNQLAKCAEANGLRKAFPRVLGGVYISEEMEQAGPGENAPLVAAAAQPTARERIAARRQAIEGHPEGFAVAQDKPLPLTYDNLMDLVEQAQVDVAYAQEVFTRLHPDLKTAYDLDDMQRGVLWQAIADPKRDADEAPTEGVFTEFDPAESARIDAEEAAKG